MESPAEAVLRDLVRHYSDNYLFENAKFFAERLYYGNPHCDPRLRSEYLLLLARCYQAQGEVRQVYHLLRGDTSLPGRYLFAQSCVKLKRFPEAEKALFPFKGFHPSEVTEKDLEFIPGKSAGLYLLGVICRHEQRRDYAIAYFQQTLRFDKNCWVALCSLCEMGVSIDTSAVYGIDLDAAFERVRASQDPISSLHTLPASTNNNMQHERNVNSAATGPSLNSGDVLKFQRGHVMERRHIAEHLGDPNHTPPNTAMSLGLSSLALHVGFASPGSMPSPNLKYNATHTQKFVNSCERSIASNPNATSGHINSFSQYSSDAPLSAMAGGDSNYRAISLSTENKRGGIGNKLFASPDSLLHMTGQSQEHLQSVNGNIHNRPGMMFDTPGLTPINAGRRSVDGAELMTDSVFPMSLERDHGSDSGSGLSLPPPPPGNDEGDSHFPEQVRVGKGDGTRRRVSFDPSAIESPPRGGVEKKKIAARLSFSSAGKGFMDGNNEESEDFSSNTDNAPPEKFQRLKDDDDYEYDFKTPGMHQIHESNVLSSPQDIAQNLYDRVQKQSGNSESNVTPAPRKNIRSLGKASRIPVANRAKAPQIGLGSSRGRNSLSPPPGSRATPGMKSPTASKQAAGRGAGRSTDGANFRSKIGAEDSYVEEMQTALLQKEQQYKECWEIGQAVVFSVLSVFGQAYHLLCQYQCTECIRHLQLLPRRHYSSGWVQHILGKAYFELNDYKAAQLALQEMLRLEPFRVKGTETLSTALWHLKREKELCALAQQVSDIDKLSPETWCVVGNCFSLQKEHDTALKFFARSIQIDPSFTYAHTLSGHEYICNEDLDKAQSSFRDAIFHDERHYNAWYGLGTIYLRQERIELAEYHFKRAIAIHPTSSILQTYLGMVLNAYDRLDKNAEAIVVLREACKYDNRNSMLFFQLAHVLLKNGTQQHLEDALSALHIVKEYAPKEPPVYSTLGEVCHKLGRNQEALKYFNAAINLDHKQAPLLKPILDAIQDPYLNSSL